MTIEQEIAGIETAISAGAADNADALKDAKERLDGIAARAGEDRALLTQCSRLYLALTERFAAEMPLLALANSASKAALETARKASDIAAVTGASVTRGELLLTLGDRREALECLVDAAETTNQGDIEPALSVRLWTSIGRAWFGLENFERLARDSFAKAVDFANGGKAFAVTPLVMLGASELLCGEGAEAAQTLQRAARLSAEEPTAPWTLANLRWWNALRSIRAEQRAEAEAELAAIRKIVAEHPSDRLSMLASTLEGLLQLHFVDNTGGIAALVAVQQRVNAIWPPLREPLLALREAAAMKGAEQVHRAYLEHVEAEAKRDAALQKFAREAGPGTSDELLSLLQAQGEVLANKAERESAQVINVLLDNTIIAELREDASGEHPYRVGALAAHLARRIGQDAAFCKAIEIAAALHDIGKVGLPDSLVLRRGRLEPHQREVMQEHAETGWRLLSEQKVDHPVLRMGARIARHHHEHWDGNGYPGGFVGEETPLEARITALAEVFDALTHKRPWRAARSVDNALKVIESLRGYQFDPFLTEHFAAMVRELVMEHGSGLDAYLGKRAQRSALLATRKALLDRSYDGADAGFAA